MPPPELIPGVVPAVVAGYLCLLGPGHAWWRGRGSSYPPLLARLAVSALATTLVCLVLAAFDAFTLPRVVLVNGTVTLVGYLLVGRLRDAGAPPAEPARALPIILLATLWLYWPPFETFIGSQDAVTYTTAGIQLARHGTLGKEDDLGVLLQQSTRERIFGSVLNHPSKPPFMRMRGGIILETKDATTARPSFFPVPILWSALFSDSLGARYAGGYAALFAALAVAATWGFARRLLPATAALAVTVLCAANGAALWTARLPLSEPLAWFFLWVGLGALDAWDEDGVTSDARLAGWMLGAVGIVRVEYALLLLCLLAARYLGASFVSGRPLSAGFQAGLTAMLLVAAAQTLVFPGAYTAPLIDALRVLDLGVRRTWAAVPLLCALAACVLALGSTFCVRRYGMLRTLATGFLAGFVVAYTVYNSELRLGQTLAWLGGYAGLPAIVAAAFGIALTRKRLGGHRTLALAMLVLGGLVLYDPHVMPTLPWGSRRLVPFVLPAVFVFAAIALVALGARRPLTATAAWILVFAFTLVPPRPLWAREFYGGSYRQLAEIHALLPQEGTVLIDASLGPYLMGIGLWYAFDRNTLPVDVSTSYGRDIVLGLANQLEDRGKLYLVKRATDPDHPIPFVRQRPYADYVVELLLPKVTRRQPSSETELLATIVAIRELERVKRPRARSAPRLR